MKTFVALALISLIAVTLAMDCKDLEEGCEAGYKACVDEVDKDPMAARNDQKTCSDQRYNCLGSLPDECLGHKSTQPPFIPV